MKFKPYHKIKQFKDIVRNVTHTANFKGVDDEGNPIYEESEKPTIPFIGTIKLHGTNASVYYTPESGIIAGKRTSGLDPKQLSAHMGFNQFVQIIKKDYFHTLLNNLWKTYCLPNEQIILYGEWAGKGIQKSVAVSELNKAFYIFDCKIYNPASDTSRWVDISKLQIDEEHVHNIHNFTTFNLDIDFNNPKDCINQLSKITDEVEKECPVSKQLGISGTGEGVVWTGYWNGEKYVFKVKGQKHSVTKVKKLASADPELLKSISSFVEYACTKNRMDQAILETDASSKKDTPKVLKWIANDIISEESDTLIANNLEWKQVAGEVATKMRIYFFDKLNQF
jgi:hypothetical protein